MKIFILTFFLLQSDCNWQRSQTRRRRRRQKDYFKVSWPYRTKGSYLATRMTWLMETVGIMNRVVQISRMYAGTIRAFADGSWVILNREIHTAWIRFIFQISGKALFPFI